MIDLGPLRCVVFDLDDTLYLERDYVRSGFVAVGRYVEQELGLTTFASRAWASFCAGARGRVFDRVLSESGIPPTPALVSELVQVYRNHSPAIVLEPDALELLDMLCGSLDLAVVSDGFAPSQRAKVTALGLGRWVNQIIITAEYGPEFAKPGAAAFRVLQERFSRSDPECLYVADNPAKDFAGPLSLGWQILRVNRPGSLHHAVPAGIHECQEIASLHPLARMMHR